MTDIERCDKEIADAEAMLRAGHRDVQGLFLKLMDWSIERRILSDGRTGSELVKRMETMWV